MREHRRAAGGLRGLSGRRSLPQATRAGALTEEDLDG
jgi:hypothetical protein